MGQMSAVRTNMSQSTTNNLSSFDSLIRMPSQQKNVPMNQMRNTSISQSVGGFMPQTMNPGLPVARFNSPMVPHQTSANNAASTNQLSKDDLLDFLG